MIKVIANGLAIRPSIPSPWKQNSCEATPPALSRRCTVLFSSAAFPVNSDR